MNIDLAIWLGTSIILFLIGVYGLATKSNGMKMIFAIEILVCAANLVLIGIGYLLDNADINPASQSYTLLSLGVGGAIVGLALAMLTKIYRQTGSADLSGNVILRW